MNHERIKAMDAAVEELESTGYLRDETINRLTAEEYLLVLDRARTMK